MDVYTVTLRKIRGEWQAEIDLYPNSAEPPFDTLLGHMNTGPTPQDALEKLAGYWRRAEALNALIAETAGDI